jgi:hypothetical protein
VVFKKFILGSLLVASLTACPIVEPGPEPVVSPIAKDDVTSTTSSTAATIKPADNDIKGSADLVISSIDLDASKDGQQTSVSDSTGKGTFKLTASTGIVTFTPVAGKTGDATTRYTIKDSNGYISSVATIRVTIGTVTSTGPIRVLFIGNSRTFYPPCGVTAPNVSGLAYDIPQILKDIAVNETRKLEKTTYATCGSSLEQHWNSGTFPGTPRGLIAERRWDYVVLQANTVETDTVSELQDWVSRFNTEIKAAGAKTILYENWWKRTVSTQATVTPIFETVASNLAIKLAPAGEAWKRSGLSEDQLFNTDGDLVHATPLGAYTAASTFYWLFYNKAPSTTVGVPAGIAPADASARSGAKSAYDALNSSFRLP